MESRFSHVALLVPSVESSARFLNSKGVQTEEPESFESEGTKEVYVGSYDTQSGLLLLVEAAGEGPYLRALNKRGPSLHHLAVDVLDIGLFSEQLQKAGWILHPVSQETMSYDTAWFFVKGIPALLEVHQKKTFSTAPEKVSRVELPIAKESFALFEAAGLGEIVVPGEKVQVCVDGQDFLFEDILSSSEK